MAANQPAQAPPCDKSWLFELLQAVTEFVFSKKIQRLKVAEKKPLVAGVQIDGRASDLVPGKSRQEQTNRRVSFEHLCRFKSHRLLQVASTWLPFRSKLDKVTQSANCIKLHPIKSNVEMNV